ncbi:hypothetical protein [Lutibacter sp.]
MRQNFLTKALKYSWVLVLALVVFSSSCKDDPIEPTPNVVEDGWYVKGAGTALTELDSKGLMKATKNEVGQADRATLLELYIAVKGGSDGFSIVNVVGGEPTSYGPGTDFAVVPEADRTNDEPKVDFWRGKYAASETAFTVTTDGLYHVVIDTEFGKVVVVPVAWGVIGGATPNGWGGSTDMTTSFDLNKMTFTVSDMELRGGEWKFRYSNGWKVEIDTTDSNPDNHVKVNTNFGGAIDALVPGGGNITNDAPGVYTCELVWTLGAAYAATLTKTADLPLTNWTDVICDAVGDGVSSDNTNAIADPSSWGWGNKLLADGAPVKTGDIYTWTWSNITLEASSGFKLRTEDGVAPSSGNGANFDVGLEAVDHTASSANVDAATSGNISVSVKAVYNIVLTIDAANSDAKKIVITDAK